MSDDQPANFTQLLNRGLQLHMANGYGPYKLYFRRGDHDPTIDQLGIDEVGFNTVTGTLWFCVLVNDVKTLFRTDIREIVVSTE